MNPRSPYALQDGLAHAISSQGSLPWWPLHTHSSGLPILGCRHERSAASVVSGIHFSLMLQQHPEPRDIVREGSGVKGGPGGDGQSRVKQGTLFSLAESKARGLLSHSPSFGVSAVHNLGTQGSQQHLCGAVLVINSVMGRWGHQKHKT